jgi:hypothetical protein
MRSGTSSEAAVTKQRWGGAIDDESEHRHTSSLELTPGKVNRSLLHPSPVDNEQHVIRQGE